MIPVGYMAKIVADKPNWLKSNIVKDIYSVSGCVSNDFADYISYWKHNGWWFFDSPEVIQQVAKEYDISLEGTKIFFYEVYEQQCYEDNPAWEGFEPEDSFITNVKLPEEKKLEGYDIVSFTIGSGPECSYLSCNHMAEDIDVNEHCLLSTFEKAKELLEKITFKGCEPGPCRIIAVYTC